MRFLHLLSGKKAKRVYNQADFDSLVIEQGDTVQLKRGETFTGAIDISVSNVTIEAFGVGDKPVLRGSNQITGTWTDEGDGTFSIAVTEPNQLYNGSGMMRNAETPWITITGQPALNQISIDHNDVSGYGDITGSKLIVKFRPWVNSRVYYVTAYDGAGTITLDRDFEGYDGTFYSTSALKLTNKKAYITNQYDWAYEGGLLYVKDSTTPNVRAGETSTAIKINSLNTTIRNIAIKEYDLSGIESAGYGMHIDSCDILSIKYIGILGDIKTDLQDLISITGCTINDIGQNAISIIGRSSNVSIKYNTITNVGQLLPHNGFTITSTVGDAVHIPRQAGDNIWPANAVIERNTIYNIAYAGIHVQGDNHIIKNNVVHDVMNMFTDGACIYMNGGPENNGSNITIEGNIAYNAFGNLDGVAGVVDYANGIYMDDGTKNSTALNNTVYNTHSWPLYINGGKSENPSYGNSVDNNNFISKDGDDTIYISSNSVTDNIVKSLTGNVLASWQVARNVKITRDYNTFQTIDNNRYIQPYGAYIGSRPSNTIMTLADMRSVFGGDANSTERVNYKTYVSEEQAKIDVRIEVNETDTEVTRTVPNGYYDVDGNPITEVTLPPFSSQIILKL